MFQSMFHMPLPVMEKILRPVIVYLFLIFFLRLVVLLSLSNTVQNAMIGDDNSVSGGIIGAFALLAINWLVLRLLFRHPKVNQALEGSETLLVLHGHVDYAALKRETITEVELLSAIHKQGLSDISEVEKCVLEPNGAFYVEAKKPGTSETHIAALQESIELLTREVQAMRAQLPAQ
jgi:uncharacterized membrane protein YcaP (DUF421 family)